MLTQKNHPLKKTSRIAFVIVLLPLIIPLAVAGLIFFFFYRIILYLLIWLVWLPRGKDVLYVSSDSSIWRDYMAEQILPLVDNRAVILNWSEREKWRYGSFSPRIFRAFGGSREFNPLVVVFRPLRRAKCFRFLKPFRAWKAGDREPVEQLRQDLASFLKASQP